MNTFKSLTLFYKLRPSSLVSLSALLVVLSISVSCKTTKKATQYSKPDLVALKVKIKKTKFVTGADDLNNHFELFENKKVGIVTNQTGLVNYDSILQTANVNGMNKKKSTVETHHIVDYIYEHTPIQLVKIFAPEHGFRGTADAGELVNDSKDVKTGLPILSLYGNNKKPTPEQLQGIDIMLFDLQDVGARFYTYISHLHYVMEACAENNIMLIILDRPNPNGGIVDGPILNPEYSSFVGMHPVPVLHGMTIGEYALMINGQGWLKNNVQCQLKIIPCENYSRTMPYTLPVNPSPNLPNAQAINLYASLCFFEGTNVSVGRGTTKQFQIYGSPYLPKTGYSFKPEPNFGAKNPLHNGVVCYGEDLTNAPKVQQLELKWLLKAYNETSNQETFFNSFFTKLAGSPVLQNQIVRGFTEEEIRKSWEEGLKEFKKMRADYLMYP
ncbi:DUF1343 domain-containing protein [Flavobacterium sp.]|uniref:exo-beta-N-acetylmuramidase NamZ family protein n=1 Tax=Flavobacterium sp. TaxID=239 RepID=UPI002603603D|nr:DUF1343 domain-containing protein [Flavobacterium sp.]MDD3005504.1 DUF1343 domain-containing protein [Flavobacterium sp.]